MPRVPTHYDNLKVSRDAPIEVIRAAYRSLATKYHPDLHPGSEKAARIMRIINTSYGVLSDTEKRAQHDRWIASTEADPTLSDPVNQKAESPLENNERKNPESDSEWIPPYLRREKPKVTPWDWAKGLVIASLLVLVIGTAFVPNGGSRDSTIQEHHPQSQPATAPQPGSLTTVPIEESRPGTRL